MNESAIFTEIGDKLRHLRTVANLTQEELADKMSTDPATVARNEHGKNISLDCLIKYSEVFNVNVADLFPSKESNLIDKIVKFQTDHNLSNEEMSAILEMAEKMISEK